MPRLKKRNPSAKQVEANRRNAENSTGPRTPQGKAHVALNALKHGLQAGPFVQGMLALHEDPRAYYRLLGELLASLRPANPHQRMQVEDIARLRVEKQRLERARAALVVGKVRGLERQRHRRLLDFDCEAPDLPQAELLEKGLYRAADSPPKFEKMLSCFDVLISLAKQGQWRLDPEPELNLLYGQQPSLEGAYLRNVFRRFVAAESGAGPSPSESRAARAAERGDGVPISASNLSGDRHGVREVRDPGAVELPQRGEGGAAYSAPDPESRNPNPEGAEAEPERLLLLQTLFAAKQHTLRRYQLYNREFVEITPDQRDACFAPSDRTDTNLMRQEVQNERQLRWALKLYWQTQKEDAAGAAQPEGQAEETDELLEALEQSAADISKILDAKQSHQVIDNSEEVSGIGQNKANFGHSGSGVVQPATGKETLTPCPSPIGRGEPRPLEVSASPTGRGRTGEAVGEGGVPLSPALTLETRNPNSPRVVGAARPKVKELLEQMQSDPEARALVETFLLSHMVGEESLREEQELAAWQRERQKRETLEEGLEQMVAAQQELESKNRRLRAQMGASDLVHQQVREQVKPAEAVVATRREPTYQEIYQKIREVVGLGGPEEFYSDEVEEAARYHVRERQYLDHGQEQGPAWEEEQRRRREQEQERLDSERVNGPDPPGAASID